MQEQEISQYKWAEYIRKRPAMFIGDLSLPGFKQMLEYLFEEVLINTIDNPVFDVSIERENRISIKITNVDNTEVIKHLDNLRHSDDRISSLGFGVPISLSSDISITINEPPTQLVLQGQKGNFETAATTSQKEESFLLLEYTVDDKIFQDFELVYEQINSFFRQFTLLNPGLKIISTDNTSDELQRNIFYYPRGIFNQLDYIISQQFYPSQIFRLDIEAIIGKYSYKIGILYSANWLNKYSITTYAGNIETYLGGSLYDGIIDGLIQSVKEVAETENTGIIINRKSVKEGLTAIAIIRGDDLSFAGSTKRKLGMPAVKKDVKQLVAEKMLDYLKSNPKALEFILKRIKKRD